MCSSDLARPLDKAASTTPSPPNGPMTRSRAKAIHDKVNLFLYSCDIEPTMDGMLPHANTLCILRHEPQRGRFEEGRGDGQASKMKQPETAGVSAVDQPDTPPTPESPPCTDRTLRPLSLDLDAPACDISRVPRSDTSRRLPGVSARTGQSRSEERRVGKEC